MKKILSAVLCICMIILLSVTAFAAETVTENLVYGDINGDGRVNVVDASLLRRHSAKMIELSEEQVSSADVNGDGEVNVMDINYVRQSTAEVIAAFPVEVLYEGVCGAEGDGTNLKWSIDIYNTLEIYGVGAMEDYGLTENGETTAPWNEYKDKFDNISVKKGVVSMGDFAFWEMKDITGELSFAKTVIEIGDYAFAGSGLTGELKLPEKLEKIGTGSFMHCEGFSGDLVIPASLEIIGYQSFSFMGCNGKLVLNDGLVNIGPYAFRGSPITGTLDIPDTVESINDFAFYHTGLSGEIYIPAKVEYIGPMVFNANGFTGFKVDEENQNFSGDKTELYDKNKTFLYTVLPIRTEAFVFPETVTGIAGYAFAGTNVIGEEIVIPDQINWIGCWAFYFCEDLEKIYFEGNAPFVCSNDNEQPSFPAYATLYYYEENTGWEENFDENEKWNGYNIDVWTDAIYRGYCGVEGNEKSVRWYYFEDGTLEIKSMGEHPMKDYDSPYGAPWYFLIDLGINDLVIREGVTHIGSNAFNNLQDKGELELPDSVESIGTGAFAGCSFTGEFKLPAKVKVIPYGAFAYCNFSGTLTIPEGVEKVSTDAFAFCDDYDSIYISSTVKEIGKMAFPGGSGKNSIKKIEVNENNEYFASLDGVLFTKDMKKLVLFPNSREGRYTVPETVETIGEYAFCGAPLISDVTVPKNVKVIEDSAFNSCDAKIRIKGKLEYLGKPLGVDALYFYGEAPDHIELTNLRETVFYHIDHESWAYDENGKWNGYPAVLWEPEYASFIIGEKKDGTLKIELTENDGITMLMFVLGYDSEKITVTSVTAESLPGVTINTGIPGSIYAVWDAISPVKVTDIITISFEATNETAGFYLKEGEDFIFADGNYEEVKIEVINDSIY